MILGLICSLLEIPCGEREYTLLEMLVMQKVMHPETPTITTTLFSLSQEYFLEEPRKNAPVNM